YLCTAGRYFGRWLMPTYPVLALLAGLAVARAAAWLGRGRALVAAGALAVIVAGVLVQPLITDVRFARLMGREDTRTMARTYLLASLPNRARVVVEPATPGHFFDNRL